MKKLIFTLFAALAIGGAQAQTEDYKTELRQFMENSGAMGAIDQMPDNLTAMMETMGGGKAPMSEEQKKEFKAIVDKLTEWTLNVMAPIYYQEISLDDLKAFNEFYDTPAGKRIAAAQPKMAKAMMENMPKMVGQMMEELQPLMEQMTQMRQAAE